MTLVPRSHASGSTTFDVVLADGSHQVVAGVDAYQQESSMTTFFRNEHGRQSVDCWSVRVASFRTDQILAIRRQEALGQAETEASVRHLHPA